MKVANGKIQYEFYNQQRKQEFIADVYGTARGRSLGRTAMQQKAIEFFRDMRKYEAEIGKDLSEMTENELLGVLRAKQYMSGTMLNRARVAGTYLKWSAEHYGTYNMFDDLSGRDIAAMVGVADTAWCPLEKIAEYVSEIQEPNTRLWIKAMMLAAYYGIYNGWVENLNHLSVNNIRDGYVTTYDGRMIPLPDDVIEAFIQCAAVSSVRENLDGSAVLHTFTYAYQDSTFVFKGLSRTGQSKSETDVRRFKHFMNDLDRLIGCDLNLGNIRDTGTIQRVHDYAEQRGEDLVEDMRRSDVIYTTSGKNRTWLYNGILYELGYDMTWATFMQNYYGWRRFLKNM